MKKKFKKFPGRRFCRCLLALVLLSSSALPAAAASTERKDRPPRSLGFQVEELPGKILLQRGEETGSFVTAEPVNVRILTRVPASRLVLVANTMEGPGKAQIETKELFIRRVAPKPRKDGKEAAFHSLEQPFILSPQGPGYFGSNRRSQEGAFLLRCEPGADLPTGIYRGQMRFYLHPGRGAPAVMVGAAELRLEVDDIFRVEIDAEQMDFQASSAGDCWPEKSVRVRITTNIKDAEAVFQMREITNTDDEDLLIPLSRVALATGADAEAARRTSRNATLGTDEVRWRLEGAGVHTLYLDGRINVTPQTPPGTYRGSVMITVGRL